MTPSSRASALILSCAALASIAGTMPARAAGAAVQAAHSFANVARLASPHRMATLGHPGGGQDVGNRRHRLPIIVTGPMVVASPIVTPVESPSRPVEPAVINADDALAREPACRGPLIIDIKSKPAANETLPRVVYGLPAPCGRPGVTEHAVRVDE